MMSSVAACGRRKRGAIQALRAGGAASHCPAFICPMKRLLVRSTFSTLFAFGLALALRAEDAPAKKAPRPANPTRSPTAPGTPKLTVVGAKAGDSELRGAPGLNPPANVDGDFLIGPDYVRAPELTASDSVPKGRIEKLTMKSEDSKFYPGITRVAPGADANAPRSMNLAELKTYPKPYTRTVTVYIPPDYKPGTPAPVIIGADGPDNLLPIALDNLIAQH